MIRKYRQADLDALIDVWYSASKIAHYFLDNTSFERERVNIVSTYLPEAETWIYELDEKVVGFIALIGNEVGGLFVHPQYQGKGIGRSLMDHASKTRNKLVLNVFEDNLSAIRFYNKYGYIKIEEVLHEETGKNQFRMALKCL